MGKYNKQFHVRLPLEMETQLKTLADREMRSLSSMIRVLIALGLERIDGESFRYVKDK